MERDVGPFQPAAAFDVNGRRPVDQDVGDGRVAEQRLDRAQPERLVDQLVDQLLALVVREQVRAIAAQLFGAAPQFAPQLVVVHLPDGGDIQPGDEPLVNVLLQPLQTIIATDGIGDGDGGLADGAGAEHGFRSIVQFDGSVRRQRRNGRASDHVRAGSVCETCSAIFAIARPIFDLGFSQATGTPRFTANSARCACKTRKIGMSRKSDIDRIGPLVGL